MVGKIIDSKRIGDSIMDRAGIFRNANCITCVDFLNLLAFLLFKDYPRAQHWRSIVRLDFQHLL